MIPMTFLEDPNYRAMILSDGPTYYWPMDDGSGVDLVAGKTMTAVGSAGFAGVGPVSKGGKNKAGTTPTDSSSRFSTVTVADIGAVVTLELWVKMNASPPVYSILLANRTANTTGNHVLDFEPYLRYSLNTSAGWEGTNWADWPTAWNGIWKHIVVTVSASKVISCYVDGIAYGTPVTYTGTYIPRVLGWSISSAFVIANASINGSFAHAAVYNYNLTTAQILKHFKAGRI